jgi:hypothetical protein
VAETPLVAVWKGEMSKYVGTKTVFEATCERDNRDYRSGWLIRARITHFELHPTKGSYVAGWLEWDSSSPSVAVTCHFTETPQFIEVAENARYAPYLDPTSRSSAEPVGEAASERQQLRAHRHDALAMGRWVCSRSGLAVAMELKKKWKSADELGLFQGTRNQSG